MYVIAFEYVDGSISCYSFEDKLRAIDAFKRLRTTNHNRMTLWEHRFETSAMKDITDECA